MSLSRALRLQAIELPKQVILCCYGAPAKCKLRVPKKTKTKMPRPSVDQRRKYIAETNLDTGIVISERYLLGKRLHRDPSEGPAAVDRFDDGALHWFEYCVNGKPHREDGPSRVVYFANGLVREEAYSVLGHLHRDPMEGPACVRRNEQGVVTSEFYIFNREFYRDPAVGPHTIVRRDDGTVEREEYSKPGAKRPKPQSGFRKALAALARVQQPG